MTIVLLSDRGVILSWRWADYDDYDDYSDGAVSGEFDHESYWGPGPVFATCDGGAFTVSSQGGEVLIIIKAKWTETFNIIIIMNIAILIYILMIRQTLD